jgi:hypothetical protein
LPEIAIWNPNALIRVWKRNNIVRRKNACDEQLIDLSITASLWLRLPWSRPLVSGRANNVPPEVNECFPDRGFDRLRTSFHLAHQHRALNGGDTEVSQPILVSVCRQSALCLFP